MSQKKIIGIDIDDTLTNSSEVFIKYAMKYNQENNINFKIDTTQWDLNKAFGWNSINQKDFLEQYLKILLNEAKPKENAVNIINKLAYEGHKIILITARHEKELENPYDFTKAWLELNNVNYNKLIVNSIEKEKACLEYGVEIFIDDNFKNCMNVYNKLHIPVILFNSNYNQNDIYNGIDRIYSWDEVYIKIKNLCK